MANKLKDTIDIQDAMDNLAAIASIDLNNSTPLGIVKKHRIVTSEEEFGPETVQWLSGEGGETILAILDLTYRSIHHHLMKLYESSEINWESEKTRKGIAAMMVIVGESAKKIQTYLENRMGKTLPQPVAEREDFKALQRFYTQQFVTKFENGVEGEKAWQEEWEKNPEALLLDETKTGLKDFETVRKDSEYELFYMRNEEGKPYFNAELLRNIKLSCDFDIDADSFEEDPLLKVRAMQDRDLHATAGQMLNASYVYITDFYHIAHKLENNELAQSLGMAVLALFLASNPRYLLQNTIGKSCLQYFEDFHYYLRRAMRTSEYQKLIAYTPDKSDKAAHLLLHLTHSLCKSFFERAGGIKLESIGLVHRLMRRGEEVKQQQKEHLLTGETIWNQMLLEDENFRTWLAKFPNGPLFKILDLIRSQDEEEIPYFDPIGHENLPGKLYEAQINGKNVEFLRLPSPTRQAVINKVEIVDEFRGFLRALAYEKKALLLVNLQDRTSWKEYTRSKALETLQMSAEFSHQLFVLTLPKNTDFYYQINEYLDLNNADDFLAAFRLQLASPEECGYYFPPQLKKAELQSFIDQMLPTIHQNFFDKKNTLSRRNRENFIEIFYQFLILKCIELLNPHAVSFTCKDAVDTSAAEQGIFYGFLKLLTEGLKSKEEFDFLRYLLYTPALFVRERAIDPERLNQALTVLDRLEGSEMKLKNVKFLSG